MGQKWGPRPPSVKTAVLRMSPHCVLGPVHARVLSLSPQKRKPAPQLPQSPLGRFPPVSLHQPLTRTAGPAGTPCHGPQSRRPGIGTWGPVGRIWAPCTLFGLHDVFKTHEIQEFPASFDQSEGFGPPPSCQAHPVPGPRPALRSHGLGTAFNLSGGRRGPGSLPTASTGRVLCSPTARGGGRGVSEAGAHTTQRC